jgi:Icc-related predicted phosphoesterase
VRSLFHLGDFGIWPGTSGRKYLDGVENSCRRYGVTIYVTPGNHEDWSRIVGMVPEQRDDFGHLLWLTDHIAVLPRGHRFKLGGRTFVSLGGAPSVDFESRTWGADWWPEEVITKDVAKVVEGGYADVMLAHDSPDHPWQSPRVAQMCTSNPQGWSRTALSYAAVGRNRLTQAFLGVQPCLFVHGHYHLADDVVVDLADREHDCRIVALDMDGTDGNIALFDPETLGVQTLR